MNTAIFFRRAWEPVSQKSPFYELLQLTFASATLSAFESRLHNFLIRCNNKQLFLLVGALDISIAKLTKRDLPHELHTKLQISDKFVKTVMDTVKQVLLKHDDDIESYTKNLPHKSLEFVRVYVKAFVETHIFDTALEPHPFPKL